ncbi:MAG: stage II sporulation protein M, partial [Candidatus Hydrothermarchaeota archaeon]|nr:stage II sporulation protein M [Candidatus Hydrothermarchaeota archaeon]
MLQNSFVLDSIFTRYICNPWEYFLGLLSHGFLEILAILLAGSIGYTIANAVFSKSENLETKLARHAKNQENRLLIVFGL